MFHLHNKLLCAFSSCEDLLPVDISHALMEVMCEQLQNVLYTFHQQQTAERTDLDSSSKSTNLIGVANLVKLNVKIKYVFFKEQMLYLLQPFCWK